MNEAFESPLRPGLDLMQLDQNQALQCVIQMTEAMLSTYDRITGTGRGPREPSFHATQDVARQVTSQLRSLGCAPASPVIDAEDEDENPLVQTLHKRFWLKSPPAISVKDYLLRFHRYCKSSPATYLAAGHYVYQLCVVQRKIALTRRNVYRLYSAAFVIAAKVVEDLLYPRKRYSTTLGVSNDELSNLEIAFLYLIDFDLKLDRERLEDSVEDWVLLVQTK